MVVILAITMANCQIYLSKDDTFGTNGKFSFPLNSNINPIYLPEKTSIYKSADNAFFLMYDIGTEDIPDLHLIKIKLDGSLDASFGTNGQISLPNYAYASGGRIYLENHKNDGFVISYSDYGLSGNAILIRYSNNGILDSSFGINGKIINLHSGGTTKSQVKPYSVLEDGSILFYNGNTALNLGY